MEGSRRRGRPGMRWRVGVKRHVSENHGVTWKEGVFMG